MAHGARSRVCGAAGAQRARVVGHRIRGVAAEDTRHDRDGRISVDPLQRQVRAVGECERKGHEEHEGERGDGTERGEEDGPALAQPARKYARHGRTDARG